MDEIKEKIVDKINKQANDIEALEEENERLREKLAAYKRREDAEELILEARDQGDNVPDQLAPDTLQGFLAKRAQLEDKPEDELEKLATMLSMWDDNLDAFELSDVPSEQDTADSLDEWVKRQSFS